MKSRLLTAIVALLFGVLGMGLWVAGIHLYQDHQNLHALIALEMQRQQAQQKALGPATLEPMPSKPPAQ